MNLNIRVVLIYPQGLAQFARDTPQLLRIGMGWTIRLMLIHRFRPLERS